MVSTLWAGLQGRASGLGPRAFRPRPSGQGHQAKAPKPADTIRRRTNEQMDGWTDGRTDKISPVFYRTLSLWGRCPTHNRKIWRKKEKQGEGTADHILTLVNYCHCGTKEGNGSYLGSLWYFAGRLIILWVIVVLRKEIDCTLGHYGTNRD